MDNAIKSKNKGSSLILGIIFTAAGALTFFQWGLPPLKYARKSIDWPSVSGTVTKSDIVTRIKDGKTTYIPEVIYTYSVNNTTYTSAKIIVGNPHYDSNIGPVRQTIQKYPVGETVQAYYDPEIPASATLIRGIQNSDYVLAGITGLFMVIGLFLLVDGSRKKLRKESDLSRNEI